MALAVLGEVIKVTEATSLLRPLPFTEAAPPFLEPLPFTEATPPLLGLLPSQNLPKLNCVAAQTVAAFGVDGWLQNQLLHAGALWHLFLFVFNYDYTLDESGVEASDESNQQVRTVASPATGS